MLSLFKLVRLCCTLLGLLVIVVSLTPFVSWAERRMPVDWYDGDADVLVILGGSMLVDGTGPQATLGYDSYLRCTYATWVLQRHSYKFIVVSGPDGLAEAMAKYLEARGTPAGEVLIENAARTTFQNAEFVKNILDHQAGLAPHPKIVVLTSDYHSSRARRVFEHAGLPVNMSPVPDLAKRAESPILRWNAFLDLTEELTKTAYYRLTRKI